MVVAPNRNPGWCRRLTRPAQLLLSFLISFFLGRRAMCSGADAPIPGGMTPRNFFYSSMSPPYMRATGAWKKGRGSPTDILDSFFLLRPAMGSQASSLAACKLACLSRPRYLGRELPIV